MARLLEVCVGDPESLQAAVEGGADRIELCSALELGGLTPGPGLIARAARVSVPVYAMVRPRGGDFVFGDGEVAAMLADIAAIRDAGLAGVVLGASLPDGSLDRETLRVLVEASRGLGKTLHRAFDLVPAVEPAVETAAELGFERILSSGRARTAAEGVADLRRAHRAAAGRVAIMAGSGVNPDTVGALLDALPLAEWHGSCSLPIAMPSPRAVALGFASPGAVKRTSADEVRRMKASLAR
ncbi:MAG: copper homeostasis protein CutC [Methylobacterium mesophilicum]|nr:copper homeostasis protein CutC [Methylobacterium mesophilicum]